MRGARMGDPPNPPKEHTVRNRTRSITTIAVVAVLSLVAAACGGDDGGTAVSADAKPYVDAMKTAMSESQGEDDIEFTESQIDCLAPRWVNVIGVERLESNDITPEDLAEQAQMEFGEMGLTEKDGEALYDAFGACDVNIRELMLASLAEDDVPVAGQACFEEIFTEENTRTLMVATLVQGDDALEEDPELAPLMGSLMGCAFMAMGEEMENMGDDPGFDDNIEFDETFEFDSDDSNGS